MNWILEFQQTNDVTTHKFFIFRKSLEKETNENKVIVPVPVGITVDPDPFTMLIVFENSIDQNAFIREKMEELGLSRIEMRKMFVEWLAEQFELS